MDQMLGWAPPHPEVQRGRRLGCPLKAQAYLTQSHASHCDSLLPSCLGTIFASLPPLFYPFFSTSEVQVPAPSPFYSIVSRCPKRCFWGKPEQVKKGSDGASRPPGLGTQAAPLVSWLCP